MTRLLLDLIIKSAPSRIINVSSEAHKSMKLIYLILIKLKIVIKMTLKVRKMNWDDLQSEKSYSGLGCYSQSKLGNILFTLELEKRLKGILFKKK